MFKRLAFCVIIVIFGLSACVSNAQKVQTLPAANDNNALLWRISGAKLSKPSYLMGTIHAICPSDFIWTDAMQSALDATEKVCFEMDLDDPAMQMSLATAMMTGGKKSLKEYYAAEDYRKLADFMKDSLGLPIDMMPQLDPGLLAAMMSVKLVSCPIPDSYEGKIMGMAQKKEMEIVGLETAEQQMEIFSSMNSDSTAAALLQMIEQMDSMRSEYNKLLAAYKAQDLPALYDLIVQSPDMKAMNINTFLFDRNRNWIPQIEKMVAAQPMFIAVGAGHLWGDQGVINLLRKAGYTVEPIR
jgi:uncharacterized protein YbaP (TraB family)